MDGACALGISSAPQNSPQRPIAPTAPWGLSRAPAQGARRGNPPGGPAQRTAKKDKPRGHPQRAHPRGRGSGGA
eukprot:9393839-Alexandrium_andersonii.AAC.1